MSSACLADLGFRIEGYFNLRDSTLDFSFKMKISYFKTLIGFCRHCFGLSGQFAGLVACQE